MFRSVGAFTVAAFLLLAPAGAAGKPQEVNIQFSAYGPSQIDVLPGETVSWTNVSVRTHTVTSDTGLFESGEVQGGGQVDAITVGVIDARDAAAGRQCRYLHCLGQADARYVDLKNVDAPLLDQAAEFGRT